MTRPTQRVVAVERQSHHRAAPSTLNRPMPRWLVWLLGLLAIVAALVVLPNLGVLHVYQKHFRGNAPQVQLRLDQLSARMDEAALREHFQGVALFCHVEDQSTLGTRVCRVALGKADGQPALVLALFLRAGRLRLAILQVPWWAHGRVQDSYTRAWGTPVPAGTDGGGKPVLRWTLPGGTLEMNKTRYFGPLNYSTVLWTADGRG